MYLKHFGFSEPPFSIAPDPRYLYLSERHREALAHLLYGIRSDGGFVLLTGEVGAGKTTLCRWLLERIPPGCDLAFIFNPKLSAEELLSTICDELHIPYPAEGRSVKVLVDLINQQLLRTNAEGRKTVLIIDEAQNLSDDVLEQIRLLTNLETHQRKLLQIVLLAQPEFNRRLAQRQLRQLAQRIVARYHLDRLSRAEVAAYVEHRVILAGVPRRLFSPRVLRRIYRLSHGTPRLINVICDRALLGAYVQGRNDVDPATLEKAAREVFGTAPRGFAGNALRWGMAALTLAGVAGGLAAAYYGHRAGRTPEPIAAVTPAAATPVAAPVPSSAPAATEQMLPLAWTEDRDPAASEAAALAALLGLWRAEPPADGQAACKPGLAEGLNCLRAEGRLEDLLGLGMPAAVKLRQENGTQFYGALKRMGEADAVIQIGERERTVPRALLENQWGGEFAVLYRGPPGEPRAVGVMSRGPDVAWVARRLAMAQGREAPRVRNDLAFDLALKRRLMLFQSAQGLEVDGLAGPRTLARLAALTDAEAPRLEAKAQ